MPSFYVKHEFFLIALAFVLFSLAQTIGFMPVYDDTDCYTHALRVVDFLQNGVWKETVFPYYNHPFGDISPFTRFPDVIWTVCALPFLLVTDLKSAVYYGGCTMQAVLTVSTAIALLWAVKPFLPPVFRLATVFFYFLQKHIFMLYPLHRPDHHAPLNLLLILICGCLIRYFSNERQKKYLTAAGFLGGLCVWNCIEGFLIFYIILGALGVVWLTGAVKLKVLRRISAVLALTVVAAWILNPPLQGFFYPDRNRISFFYVAITLITAAVFFACEGISRKFRLSRKKEILSVILMTGAGIGFFILLFGAKTVFAPVYSPELVREWASYIGELQAVPFARFFKGMNLVYPLLMIVSPFFCLRRSFPNRKAFAVILTAAVVTMILILQANRFFRDYGVFFTFLLAFAFGTVRMPAKKSPIWGAAFAIGFFMYMICKGLFYPSFNGGIVFSFASQFLPPPSGSVLAASSLTPAIVWHTGYKGIGAPYHTNEEGILDAAKMLNEPYDEKTKELMIKHDVRLILIRWPPFGYGFIGKERQEKEKLLIESMRNDADFFANRLLLGKVDECGIKPYPLPADFDYILTAYTVDFSGCP